MQIYLSATQISRLDALSLQPAVNRNELVRRAVDQFLGTCAPTSCTTSKAQRIKRIVEMWADKTETINSIDFCQKTRCFTLLDLQI
jgi:hypothetical protein